MNKGYLSILMLGLGFMMACSQEKKTDWRVSFDKNSKEPYGCYLAYQSLSDMFPQAKIHGGKDLFAEIKRGINETGSQSSTSHLTLSVCRNFSVDSLERDQLFRYAEVGNFLCIVSENFSQNILDSFHATPIPKNQYQSNYFSDKEDTIQQQTLHVFVNHNEETFWFHGLPLGGGFASDTSWKGDQYYLSYLQTQDNPASLIRFVGDGVIMICRTPIAFTNHFLLQRDNRKSYERFLSFFPATISHVHWFSGYERKMSAESESHMGDLFHFPPLFSAFMLLALLLLVYALFGAKRRQRIIAPKDPLENTSLAFTETVGQLYYQRKNNKNLSDKMLTHYFEQVRESLGISLHPTDPSFAEILSRKTKQSLADTEAFLGNVEYIRHAEQVSDDDIKHLYHQLQQFI